MENIIAVKNKIKPSLERLVPGVVFALLIIQPLLDIISYWANQWEFTSVTTAVRFLMFAVIMLYGFMVSDRKRIYVVTGAAVAVYWVLHMAACFKAEGGYISPVSDASNFLRIIHLPLFTLAFVTFFKKDADVPHYVRKAFLVNLVIMIHSVILSYMTGTQVYMYGYMGVGLMGWSAVHNAQSAILALVVPLTLLYAYKKKNKLGFYLVSLAVFVCLFFSGTRVDFYSIPIIAVALIIGLIFTGEKNPFYYIVLLLMVLGALLCYKTSIAYDIRGNHEVSMEYRQEEVEQMLEVAEDDKETAVTLGANITREIYDSLDPLTRKNINTIYDRYLGGMIHRYGFDRVFEKYNYSLVVSNFLDMRQQKRYFSEMAWEDADLFTKCFGYEYQVVVENYEKTDFVTRETVPAQQIYDLENDFPAVYYFGGYVGFGLYMLFILYFVLMMAVAVITRFKKVVNVESIAVGLTFVLAMGIAYYAGYVLRRPNTSVYLSAILAYIYYLTAIKENVKLTDIFKLFSKNRDF